jgi:hypothetical protein
MSDLTRREVLRIGAAMALGASASFGQESGGGERPVRQDPGVEVLTPRARVPLSFIIDDSTCLVNMGAYCMPQFAATWPNRAEYKKPWKTWPREIPDAFVREFGEWCAQHGVKGKYSLVPYPACVGWLDRELPGWSRQELTDSLKLVRELMLPNWDIHPEMVTHTRIIDTKTGRPLDDIGPGAMENWYPHGRKSVDELADYIAFALRILKNCDIPCEGITTPGGFGNLQKRELALAVKQAVSDVFRPEIPHYFKYVLGGKESTQPRLEHVEAADTDAPRLVVNVPAGTGDWFGGWDGDVEPQGHKYANDDATAGRMVELIERGEPAVMLCHWAGMYTHGTKKGFVHFKKVVSALERRYGDRTLWMKLSEMARYQSARALTRIERDGPRIALIAPFACPAFTIRLESALSPPRLGDAALEQVNEKRALRAGAWVRDGRGMLACFDLPKGRSVLAVQ